MEAIALKPPQGSPCRPVVVRIREKSQPNADGCWIWAGLINADGYGITSVGSKMDGTSRKISAHRAAYEAFVGPIPNGLEVDHLCRIRACVNPAHLEAVSRQENIRRSDGPSAINARKTHCKNGHEFTPENTYIMSRKRATGSSTFRLCRTCEKRNSAAKYQRRRAARTAVGGDA